MAAFLQSYLHSALISALRAGSALNVYLTNIPHSWSSTLDIPSRETGRTIPCHVYASSTTSPSSPQTPQPVVLNWHGSSFVLNLHGTDDRYCLNIASQTPYTVLDLTYRLAPEHPFPAAIEDVEDALEYVLSHPELYDPSRIVLSGFSSGACFALSLACGPHARKISKVVAIYPVTDLAIAPETRIAPQAGGKMVPAWGARVLDAAYIPPGTDRKDRRLSPAHAPAEDFCDEIAIFTAGFDNLATEGEALREKLKAAEGKRISGFMLNRVNHGWDKKPDIFGVEDGVEKRDRMYAAVVDMLNE